MSISGLLGYNTTIPSRSVTPLTNLNAATAPNTNSTTITIPNIGAEKNTGAPAGFFRPILSESTQAALISQQDIQTSKEEKPPYGTNPPVDNLTPAEKVDLTQPPSLPGPASTTKEEAPPFHIGLPTDNLPPKAKIDPAQPPFPQLGDNIAEIESPGFKIGHPEKESSLNVQINTGALQPLLTRPSGE